MPVAPDPLYNVAGGWSPSQLDNLHFEENINEPN